MFWQYGCVLVSEIHQAGFPEPLPFAVLGFRERHPEIRREATVAVADHDHQHITPSYFRETRLDGEIGSRSEELHGVVLKLQSAHSIEDTLPLLTEVSVSTAQEDSQRSRHKSLVA
jgi:hypothetical protein